MKDNNQYLESIHEIRSIMERSSKFMSLSGLSGVAAGITALISGTIAFIYLGSPFSNNFAFDSIYERGSLPDEYIRFFLILATATMFVAIALAYIFTRRNAKKKNLPIWDKTAKLVTINMAIPLVTGGLFALALVFRFEMYGLVAPTTLIFYGLALINVSKYTVSQTHWLGMAEIAIGLFALLFYGYGLLFWMLGFGIFHIIYGIILYYNFERRN